MANEYGRKDGENRVVCPGEDSCEIFQGAKGRTRREKERNACIGAKCPLFPTKSDTGKTIESHQKVNAILISVIELRRERLCGSPVDRHRITTTLFEALKLLEDYYDAFERNLQIETKRYLEAALKVK